MRKLHPLIFALLIMSGVMIYYGTSNYFSGSIPLKNLVIGNVAWIVCMIFFLKVRPETELEKNQSQIVSVAIAITTIAALFLISTTTYIKAGAFMGMIVGGAAGGMLLGRVKRLPTSSRYLAPAIIGVAMFFPLREITFDVQTMASRSLEPRVRQRQKILINNLAFGARLPFSQLLLAHWGKPKIGDLVIVSGPNGRPYLREVLNVEGAKALLNTDGWVSNENILAKATPM